MAYIGLGSRPVTAAPDTTGLNPGNYSTVFDPNSISMSIPYFECYHMVVTGVTPGFQGTVYVNNQLWGFTNPLGGSEWDPVQPILLTPGDQFYIAWNIPSTGTPPQCTAWFRYDNTINANNATAPS